MVKILIKRLSSKVTMPQYKTIGSSGMDIAAFLDNEILIKPSEKKIISKSNIKILLTDIELKILVKLGQHDGEYVKKEELSKQVWGIKNSDHTHTLQTHIYRLRKKLLSKFGDKLLIKSKIGKYSLKY